MTDFFWGGGGGGRVEVLKGISEIGFVDEMIFCQQIYFFT
jgi:hypothetical protein